MLRISPEPEVGCELPSPPVLPYQSEHQQPLLNSKSTDDPVKSKAPNLGQKSSTQLSLFGNCDKNFRRRTSSPNKSGQPVASEWKTIVAGFYKRVDSTWSTVKDQEAITSRADKEKVFRNIAQIIMDAKRSTLLSQGKVDLLITYLRISGVLDRFVDFLAEYPKNSNFEILEQYLNVRNAEYLTKNGKLDFVMGFSLSSSQIDRYLPILNIISHTPSGCKLFLDKMPNFFQILWNLVCDDQKEAHLEHVSVIFTNFALFRSKDFENYCRQNTVAETLCRKFIEDPYSNHYRFLLLSTLLSWDHFHSGRISTSISEYLHGFEFRKLYERSYQEKFCKINEFALEMMSNLMEQHENSHPIHDMIAYHFRIIWHHAKSVHDIKEIFPKFDILRKIGEHEEQEIPAFQWPCEKVCDWLCQVGFENQKSSFEEHRIDGDLLFSMNDFLLENEFLMKSSYDRLRFMRELNQLKINTDYTAIDPTAFDIWLTNIQPQLSIYAYCMLKKGLDRKTVKFLNENLLLETFGVENPIQRRKILKIVQKECENEICKDRIFR